jgi:hypothetical protein
VLRVGREHEVAASGGAPLIRRFEPIALFFEFLRPCREVDLRADL